MSYVLFNYIHELFMKGTTSRVGQPRLTMIGVERRYKVKAAIISKWLDDYRGRLMKEAIDIVNGTHIYYIPCVDEFH